MRWAYKAAPVAAAAAVAVHDLVQRRHALLRNFPVVGHARFWIESIGPELRQYVVAGNDEERPFSRDQRRWVYASSKLENNYFGCRDARGRFDLQRLVDVVAEVPVRALEIKLSQGAKPGLGGLLPAAKVSPEIAEARGIPMGQDCVSPSRHAEFGTADELLDWAEMLAAETGLPVGIKSAVGDMTFWEDLTGLMADTGRGVDFVTIDGGEGGTGASPLVFTDCVSMPFRLGWPSRWGATW